MHRLHAATLVVVADVTETSACLTFSETSWLEDVATDVDLPNGRSYSVAHKRLARGQLTVERARLTRLGVTRRACALLDQPSHHPAC